MKKKLKVLLCMLLAVILCMCMAVPASAASPQYNAAVKKYNSFLKKNKGYYKIVDIDKNGIPELIYQNYLYSEIYTYNTKTKKKVRLAKVSVGRCSGAAVMYSQKKHAVLLPTLTTSDYSWTVYKITGTKVKKVLTSYYGMACASRAKEFYQINGKTVNKSTYDKKINTYKKPAKYINESNW